MRCDEYVGPAAGTGVRRQCSRDALYLARRAYARTPIEGVEVMVCGHHVRDYRESGQWVVIELRRK